jgi:NAD(P)H-dependent FMN reductase
LLYREHATHHEELVMTHIQVILGSTRQGRFGGKVANWFMQHAAAYPDLSAELVDLADWPLPFFDAPVPPAMQEPQDARTVAWADKVSAADGYVLVTPEYNHGYPAVLKNALDHVVRPWRHKPVGFVGYGGPGAGVRAVEQLRQVVVELEMVPLRQQVALQNVYMAFDIDGALTNPTGPDRQAAAVLDELAWWSRSLSHLRAAAR